MLRLRFCASCPLHLFHPPSPTAINSSWECGDSDLGMVGWNREGAVHSFQSKAKLPGFPPVLVTARWLAMWSPSSARQTTLCHMPMSPKQKFPQNLFFQSYIAIQMRVNNINYIKTTKKWEGKFIKKQKKRLENI